MIEAAQRDPARFAELYDIYFDRIYAFVARRVGSREETEDLVSEVFHKALANLRRFELRGAPFSAWLWRIAANEIADRSERVGRERAIDAAAEAEEADQEEAQDRSKVFALVRELPEDQRRVLELRFMEEKSTREVAAESWAERRRDQAIAVSRPGEHTGEDRWHTCLSAIPLTA